MLVEAYHFPFPACGHIVKSGKGYELVPAPWQPEYADYGYATLSGLAIGCRLVSTRFSVDISYADGLQSPRFLPSQQTFYVNAQINF